MIHVLDNEGLVIGYWGKPKDHRARQIKIHIANNTSLILEF